MDSYLTLLATARLPSSAVPTVPTESPHKLSARHPHHHHRKRRHVAPHATTEVVSPRARAVAGAVLSTASPSKHATDAFRSVSVLGEVVRLEADASHEKMTPEDAFALLRRILAPQDLERSTTMALPLSELLDAAPVDPVKLRYAQLYSGARAAIAARRAACASLTATLQQTTQRNDALPATVAAREAELRALKQTYMARAARALDCVVTDAPTSPSVTARRSKSASTVVDAKVQTLRRRRDLRTWACNELRDAINEHVTRASELKKAISAIVTEVKKEELAHKAKAKRIEAIMAATSSTRSAVSSATEGGAVVRQATPEERVAQAQAKKLELLEAIAQRKAALRTCTEAVFTARSDVERLEHLRTDVVETTRTLSQEIAHVQRSCTPRPNWTQLLDAAVVTTAVDRVGKHTKLRIQRSRHKLVGGSKGKGAVSESDDGDDDSDEHRLKQMLTSNWSTIEKVQAMATELTRIRTKYHADDAIGAEQAKLDHLQREIAKTLQQLDAIKGKAHE